MSEPASPCFAKYLCPFYIMTHLKRIAAFALALQFASPLMAQNRTTLPVEGGLLAYRTYGEGEPMVIVGGFAGLSSDYLEPLAIELGKRYRTYLIDQRGTGRSEGFWVDTSTVNNTTVSADVDALRKHLKVRSWTVAGHAWGGSVAITYAALYPSSVRALLLLGPTGIDLQFFNYYHTNVMQRLNAQDSAYYRSADQYTQTDKNKALFIRFHATLPAYFKNRSNVASISSTITEQSYRGAVSQVYWQAFINSNPPYAQIFSKNRLPVLIIQGNEDPVDKRTADRIAQVIRGARIEMIRSSGAFPWIEQPRSFWSKVDTFQKTRQKASSPGKK